jgi:hypothetical protein
VYLVVLLPRSLLARFDVPGVDPASTMYVVGLPDAALHDKTTVPPPAFVAESPFGAPGALVHALPTTSVASLEAALMPAEFVALTRT